MKKRLYFLLIILTFASIIWIVQFSKAKYKSTSTLELSVTSAKMYFEDNASDLDIPYSNNTANIEFDVHNYLNQNYTIQNINYTISISNPNYTFNINNTTNAVGNEVEMVLAGGTRNSETINMNFTRLDTSNVPASEDIDVTISTSYPYTYNKTFTVTILSGTIEVQGNPTNWTRNDVTLTVVTNSPGTVLTEYSFDEGNTWSSNPSKVYTENTDGITIYAKDSHGQTLGPVIVDITKIDKTPPTVTFSNDTEYKANGTPVQLTTLIATLGENTSVSTGVTSTDSQSGISSSGLKCYRETTEITSTNYFNQIGRYLVTYKVQDEAGNETVLTREILIRWPRAGKYIVAKQGYVGTGHSSSTSQNGLYKDTTDTGYNSAIPFSSKYYYAGGTVDNYVSFAGKTFRVINVATNDDVKVIGSASDISTSWGNNKIYSSNIYNTWSTKWWPRGQIYNNETGESNYYVFTDEEKAHLDLATFYAGRVDDNDDITDIIFSEQTNADRLGGDSASFEGYSAYPNVSDFLKACKAHDIFDSLEDIDTGSLRSKRQQFTSYSWIDTTAEFWTMNGRTGTLLQNNDFWTLDNDMGLHFESRAYTTSRNYRVVFYLTNTTILSGNGTSLEPFNVEENWAWFDSYQIVQ